MFKIQLNALWSRDYVTHLAQVLSTCLPCEMDEAYQRIRGLSEGKGFEVLAPTVGKAEALACDFLQYGVYIEVEQIASISDAMMIDDLQDWFDEDQQFFSVMYDKHGHVSKIIEERGYGYLRLESQVVSDWVGAELIRNGAKRLEASDWPALKERLDKATAENEERRLYIRAQRSEEKRRRMERGEPTLGFDWEEE